jgi:predicted phage terminase large subunit-like protein
LRTQVERNALWAQTFGLERGRKWEETLCEIQHKTFNHSIWITAAGINGSLRGINFDDYRPDLIIVDDPQTDETASTQIQREKVGDLLLSAVRNSLASIVEEPNAKMAMAITPQHKEDVSQKALVDSEWTSVVVPCWTRATLDLPVDHQLSSWPEMFPTDQLRSEKRAALQRNKLSLFTRERECRLTSLESAQFKPQWLNIREAGIPAPKGLFSVLAIDPVPPPSPAQMARGLQGKDFEAHYVWGRQHSGPGDVAYHLLDFARNRGHEPSWTVATAFSLARIHRVARIIVDAVAYQRTLKWILEQEMKKRGIYYQVIPIADGMKKFARISNVMSGLASNGQLWIGSEHSIFAQQFEEFGPTYTGHDDDLDASALALQDISNPYLERLSESGDDLLDDVAELSMIRACP